MDKQNWDTQVPDPRLPRTEQIWDVIKTAILNFCKKPLAERGGVSMDDLIATIAFNYKQHDLGSKPIPRSPIEPCPYQDGRDGGAVGRMSCGKKKRRKTRGKKQQIKRKTKKRKQRKENKF